MFETPMSNNKMSSLQPNTNNVIQNSAKAVDPQFHNVASKILNVSTVPELGPNEVAIDIKPEGLAQIVSKSGVKKLAKDVTNVHNQNNLEQLKNEYISLFNQYNGKDPEQDTLDGYNKSGGIGRISMAINVLRKHIERNKDKKAQADFKRFADGLQRKTAESINSDVKQIIKQTGDITKGGRKIKKVIAENTLSKFLTNETKEKFITKIQVDQLDKEEAEQIKRDDIKYKELLKRERERKAREKEENKSKLQAWIKQKDANNTVTSSPNSKKPAGYVNKQVNEIEKKKKK